MDKPLLTSNLIEASQGIRKRRFTSEAYTEALLVRIESLDEEIQAWTWLRPAEAIRAARLFDHSPPLPTWSRREPSSAKISLDKQKQPPYTSTHRNQYLIKKIKSKFIPEGGMR